MKTPWFRRLLLAVLSLRSIMAPPSACAEAPVSRLAADVAQLAQHVAAVPGGSRLPGAGVNDEASEIARLEALPSVQIPIEDASLASAIKIVAQSAGMNHIAPAPEDFAEPVSVSATVNPWRLLQLMSERYRFVMQYQQGMWLFSRESAGALIARTYDFRHANLDRVTSQKGGASFADSSGSDSGGRAQGQGFDLVYTLDSKQVVDDVRELIGLPALASQTIVVADEKPARDVAAHASGILLPAAARETPGAQKVIYLPNTQSLYVVCYRSQHEHVAEYVRQVDQPPVQIRIEARFFATSRDPQRLLGINFAEAQPRFSLSDGNAGPGGPQIDLNRRSSGDWPPQAILSADALSVQLNALESDAATEKIENPFVVTTSNHEALFSVGKEEPFLDSSTLSPGAVDGGLGSTTNRISVKRIGTAVNVVPTYFRGSASDKPKIRLVVKMELGRLDGFRQVTPLVSYPVVDSQKYQFTVTIEEGQALAFGGLTGLLSSRRETRVPVLGKIPVLGGLFRHQDDFDQQRNLIGYLIPTVVRGPTAPAPEVRLSESHAGL